MPSNRCECGVDDCPDSGAGHEYSISVPSPAPQAAPSPYEASTARLSSPKSSSAYEGHTPGPWRVGYSDGSGGGGVEHEGTQEQFEAEKGYCIVTEYTDDTAIVFGGNYFGHRTGVIGKANAALIASAPTLLSQCDKLTVQRDELASALRAIVDMEQVCDYFIDVDFKENITKARAALDKLT